MAELNIWYDLREKRPWKFDVVRRLYPEEKFTVARKHLVTGDYTAEGLESSVTIERKNCHDFINTLGQGFERIREEFRRMNELEYAAFVIEVPLQSISTQRLQIVKLPELLAQDGFFQKMMMIRMIYPRITWYFAQNREAAELLTYQILKRFSNKL